MELNQLQRIFKNLHPLASLRITFRAGNDGIVALFRLSAYDGHSVRINEYDRLSVLSILADNSWGINANRTIRIAFPLVAERDKIAKLIYNDIDKVMPGSDTPLSRLMTGRQKMLGQAITDLIREILTDKAQKVAKEWGWKIEGNPTEEDGLPQLRFTLSEGGTILAELRLDASTGQIMQDGREHQFCSCIESAQERVEQLVVDYVKKLEEETSSV